MYKLNPFVHIFRRNNIVALFNSLTLSTIYIPEKKYENILLSPPADMIQDSFFVNGNFDAINYLKKYSQKINEKHDLGIAYFLVTSQCNFKCDYCFVETRFENKHNTFMSKEIAYKGIRLIKRNTNKIKIIFYGGEPLLNFEVIKYIVDEAANNNLEAKYSIITNGSTINKAIIKFLKDNNISLSVSLDGLKDTNDKARKYKNNRGTFDRIKKTLKILKNENIQFGISCTISPYNMNKPDEILEILDEFDIRGFGYNILSENKNVILSKKEHVQLIENLLSAENIIYDKNIIEDRIINRKLRPFVEKKNWLRDCAGYGYQIVVTPDGKVGTCHGLWPDLLNKQTKHYFDIDVNYKDKIIDHPTWKEWSHRIPFNIPHCWGCFGIGLCGGGCAKNSLLRKGSIWAIDDDICILTKEAVTWVIWKYYDEKVKMTASPAVTP